MRLLKTGESMFGEYPELPDHLSFRTIHWQMFAKEKYHVYDVFDDFLAALTM